MERRMENSMGFLEMTEGRIPRLERKVEGEVEVGEEDMGTKDGRKEKGGGVKYLAGSVGKGLRRKKVMELNSKERKGLGEKKTNLAWVWRGMFWLSGFSSRTFGVEEEGEVVEGEEERVELGPYHVGRRSTNSLLFSRRRSTPRSRSNLTSRHALTH
jgi:hypothetical protein